jgi:hypothetical protein
MSSAPSKVGQAKLAIFLQTNEPVPFQPLFEFLKEIELLARQPHHLGPVAMMEVLEVQTGTKLIKLTFDRTVALTSLAVAIVALGNDIASGMKQPSGGIAESAALLCAHHGVVECVVTTSEGQIHILRDEMPAVNALENKAAQQSATGSSIELSATIPGPIMSNILDSVRQLEGASDAQLLWDGTNSTILCKTYYGGGQARELQRQLNQLLSPQDYD